VVPAYVAAAIVVDAACGALGLMMLVHVNIAGVPAVKVATGFQVTVNTPVLLTAAVAAEPVPVMPDTLATVMVAVDVNPVSVTTTEETAADVVVGVIVKVCNPVDPATAFARVTPKLTKLEVIAG